MKSIIFTIVFALGANAFAVDTKVSNNTNTNFGTAVNMYLEAYKNMAPCGYPEWDIPVLAPFRIDSIPLNFTYNSLSVFGELSNLVITGLNDYTVIDFTYDPTTNHTTYDINYASVQLLGEVNVEVGAEILGMQLQFQNIGLINKKITDLRWFGSFTLGSNTNATNSLALSQLNIQYTIGDVAVNNLNTVLDNAINNFINNLCRDLTLLHAQEMRPYLEQISNKLLLPLANNRLQGVTLQEVIDALVEAANTFNKIEC